MTQKSLKITCSALDNNDELDTISFVQSPPPLFMEMCVAKVPAMSVQQAEVVPGRNIIYLIQIVDIDVECTWADSL